MSLTLCVLAIFKDKFSIIFFIFIILCCFAAQELVVTAVPFPRYAFGRNDAPTVDVDHGVEGVEVHLGRNGFVGHAHHDLAQSRDTGSSFQVTNAGLDLS